MSVAAFATAAWPQYPELSKKNSCRLAASSKILISAILQMRFGEGKMALVRTPPRHTTCLA